VEGDNGERHAASGIGLPGGAFDPVAASGLSGIRSPPRQKRTPIAPAKRAPPYQTAFVRDASTAPPMAGTIREASDHRQAEESM